MLYNSRNFVNLYVLYLNPNKNLIKIKNLNKCSKSNDFVFTFIREFRTRAYASTGLGNFDNKNDKKTNLFQFLTRFNEIKDKSRTTKNLLNQNKLTDTEKGEIKIAFAEGYLAATENQQKKSNTNVTFRLIQRITTLFLASTIIYILIKDGKSFKNMIIGNKHAVTPEEINVTFNDALGIDEAKDELKEIVEFLRDPEKFSKLGAKLPKGVLLVGPPGTGKTLLARAVAGEAGVPFFHAVGSEFDEILVGQGARRIRDLFNAAKLVSPCVVFIDEIDSVGGKRTNSVLHPYANQTINQLLSEMDGFRPNEGVIVLGATNRRDDLDNALLRPGRFDVEVRVAMPDLNGRKEIIHYYLGKIKVAEDINVDTLAKRTLGFSGADIENMCNQAALRAAIEDEPGVLMRHLDNARDKVLMGPEKKSKIPDEEVNRLTAYHEAGHALVAYFSENADPVHKVTIIPRGNALGLTAYIPEKEQYHRTKAMYLTNIDIAMGGRVAEEMIFGEDKVTSGAYSDLQKATSIAQAMVKKFGYSNKIGLVVYENKSEMYNETSAPTLESIESEIRLILQESYERAKKLLKTHSKELNLLAQALLKYETLDLEQIKQVLDGKELNIEVTRNKK